MNERTTLTYPYGETPEEVIRERLANATTTVNVSFWPLTHLGFKTTDDLLTVLDALKSDGENVERTWKRSDQVNEHAWSGHPSIRLRISILAALGIEEG